MKTRAAVAWAAGKPLEIEEVDLAKPQAGEVLVQIVATGVAPTNDLEAAIVRELPPGQYTAIVRGTNDSTGVALVDVYGLH